MQPHTTPDAARITFREDQLPVVICDEHPEWVATYRVALQTAFNNIDYPENPRWQPQLTCMPNVGFLWQWDSCFMTFFSRYAPAVLPGMNNLDNLYRLQRADGYVSMAYNIASDQEAYGERINPPLYAWAEWEYYLLTGDDTRFARVLPVLTRFFEWIKANRRRPASELYWFEDSGSTGMDNSPRSGYFATHLDGSDVCHIDLACQQALTAHCLAEIAAHLGETAIAERFRAEHRELRERINARHWCARTGFYYDVFARSSPDKRMNFLNHKTVAGFWPIISGVASEEQVKSLVEHLLNPAEFWTRHPVPALSKDDPNYDPFGSYWLGGVWAPTNYMIAKGLERRGWHGLAREIAIKHLEAITAVLQDSEYASIWEMYSPDYLRPGTINETGQLSRPSFVGWTGLGPIAMLIEQIFGIECDASRNQITWRIDTTGRHGVENLRFNGHTLSLVCEGYRADRQPTTVTITTDGPVDITLSMMGGQEHVQSLPAGRHEIIL